MRILFLGDNLQMSNPSSEKIEKTASGMSNPIFGENKSKKKKKKNTHNIEDETSILSDKYNVDDIFKYCPSYIYIFLEKQDLVRR